MNKISKFACSFALSLFAITVTNVSFGMNPQKEVYAEQILQEKLNQLNKEKENQKTSWFNKFYFHKVYVDEPSFLNDSPITLTLILGAFILSDFLIPEQNNNFKKTTKSLILIGGIGLGEAVERHKISVKVNNEKIKNIEEILAEMKKSKGKI